MPMRSSEGPMRPLRGLVTRDGVTVIDQRLLPHRLQFETLSSPDAVFTAIRDMWVRGAPLIGAAAAYGLALQARRDASDEAIEAACVHLQSARPTAVNLAWALQRMKRHLMAFPPELRRDAAWEEAEALAEEDVQVNAAIGRHGLPLLRAIAAQRPGPVNVLTHCNAGWLATVGWGTATSPIYQATPPACPCTCGWTRRARATRAPASRRGSWARPACRTR